MKPTTNEGSVSEWNEGNLKSIRLHDIQTVINNAKMDLRGVDPEKGVFNYQVWVDCVNVLYGEGYSKYSDQEIVEVDQIKKVLLDSLRLFPPYKFVIQDNMQGKVRKPVFIEANFNIIKSLGELFEKTVKVYNDKHGLSTRNKGTSGLFG